MSEKQYNLRAGYYHNYTGIGRDTDENLTTNKVVDLLNNQEERIKELEKEKEHIETCFKMADSTYHILRKQYHNIEIALSKYRKENEKLKKELFEARKDYLIETYSDNPTRRDEKIQGLKEEFKERFGDVE